MLCVHRQEILCRKQLLQLSSSVTSIIIRHPAMFLIIEFSTFNLLSTYSSDRSDLWDNFVNALVELSTSKTDLVPSIHVKAAVQRLIFFSASLENNSASA